MKNMIRPLALATQLGVTMGLMTVTTVLAGLFLGIWLDRQLGIRPIATLLFIVLGVLAGTLGTVNLAQATMRQLNETTAEQQTLPRAAFSGRDLGRALLLVLELIAVTLLPAGLALWLGLRLDAALGSKPIATVALGAVSAAVSLMGVYVISARAARRVGQDS